MNITSDDPNHQNATVNLRGTPIFPIIGVQPASPVVFPVAVQAGNCTLLGDEQTITISNTGDFVLNYTVTLTGPFFLDAAGTTKTASGSVAIQTGTQDFDLWFCPTVDDNSVQTGVFRADSNDPANPTVNVNLQAQEAP